MRIADLPPDLRAIAQRVDDTSGTTTGEVDVAEVDVVVTADNNGTTSTPFSSDDISALASLRSYLATHAAPVRPAESPVSPALRIIDETRIAMLPYTRRTRVDGELRLGLEVADETQQTAAITRARDTLLSARNRLSPLLEGLSAPDRERVERTWMQLLGSLREVTVRETNWRDSARPVLPLYFNESNDDVRFAVARGGRGLVNRRYAEFMLGSDEDRAHFVRVEEALRPFFALGFVSGDEIETVDRYRRVAEAALVDLPAGYRELLVSQFNAHADRLASGWPDELALIHLN